MRIVVINNVSLDGVMQAPGRADEDTRGGFTHGGWAAKGVDQPDPRLDHHARARALLAAR